MPCRSYTSVPLHLLRQIPKEGIQAGGVCSFVRNQLSVANDFGVRILEQKTDTDHVHILFASKPQVQLSKFINSLKSVSSRLLRKEFPHLTKLLYKGAFWSPSYFLASCGDVSLEVLRNYVQQQGHDTNTTNRSGASR